jgi:hypothetical protein
MRIPFRIIMSCPLVPRGNAEDEELPISYSPVLQAHGATMKIETGKLLLIFGVMLKSYQQEIDD